MYTSQKSNPSRVASPFNPCWLLIVIPGVMLPTKSPEFYQESVPDSLPSHRWTLSAERLHDNVVSAMNLKPTVKVRSKLFEYSQVGHLAG